jgi:hypothetical protein
MDRKTEKIKLETANDILAKENLQIWKFTFIFAAVAICCAYALVERRFAYARG